VFKADRLLYHSTLGLRETQKGKKMIIPRMAHLMQGPSRQCSRQKSLGPPLQENLADKKQHPLGPPQGPLLIPTVGS